MAGAEIRRVRRARGAGGGACNAPLFRFVADVATVVAIGNEAYQTLSMDCPLSGWYDARRRRRPTAVT